jgi:hypothetical protein
VAITGRTSAECVGTFKEHVGALVAATVTNTYPLLARTDRTNTILGFRQGGVIAIPLETRFGRLYFYLSQSLEAVTEADGFRLRTRQYWYRIQTDPSPKAQALVRWEYDAETSKQRYARHHVQIRANLPVGEADLDLNKAHVPTGWVTMEEVIRFLIVDLGVAPPCGDSWPEKLHESEEKFYTDFTSKRYERSE